MYDIYVFQYPPGWILWYWCFSFCSWMNCIIFMSFTMLPDEFYIYGFQYTYAKFFDWPRSTCSWMNIIIFMSFSMLLDEIYDIYVFQYAPGWNVWYLCFSFCSWMNCMIFMSFSMLLDEFYDIYVFQYAPGWNLYLCLSLCSWMKCMIFMSVSIHMLFWGVT